MGVALGMVYLTVYFFAVEEKNGTFRFIGPLPFCTILKYLGGSICMDIKGGISQNSMVLGIESSPPFDNDFLIMLPG